MYFWEKVRKALNCMKHSSAINFGLYYLSTIWQNWGYFLFGVKNLHQWRFTFPIVGISNLVAKLAIKTRQNNNTRTTEWCTEWHDECWMSPHTSHLDLLWAQPSRITKFSLIGFVGCSQKFLLLFSLIGFDFKCNFWLSISQAKWIEWQKFLFHLFRLMSIDSGPLLLHVKNDSFA